MKAAIGNRLESGEYAELQEVWEVYLGLHDSFGLDPSGPIQKPADKLSFGSDSSAEDDDEDQEMEDVEEIPATQESQMSLRSRALNSKGKDKAKVKTEKAKEKAEPKTKAEGKRGTHANEKVFVEDLYTMCVSKVGSESLVSWGSLIVL